MPLVKKDIEIAAGATSEQVLAGTTYEYVGPGTRLVVAAAANIGAVGAAIGGNANIAVSMNFNVNNAEFARDAAVAPIVTGEAFGWKGNYVMNDMITTAAERNRPIITFTNNSAATVTVSVAVFIGG
jgi:hypothetical protein